ncbi:glycosyltransferase family 2 protein [Candidatus Uhrbacteria bacterium]|nr:glycosyltransferase family 2 protein [Candidatus Uhrbacteria bacterium]
MPHVSVNIVTWNSLKYLPLLFASLRRQTFSDISVLVIDNGSNDGVLEFVRANYPEVTILRNVRNLGFSAAHNQGIKYVASRAAGAADEQYVLVTNPDTILTPTFIEQLVLAAEAEPTAAAWSGKLLRVEWVVEGDFEDVRRTTVIDSTGLRLLRSRRAIERGAGEQDQERYHEAAEIFGVSGALGIYRLSALETVAMNGQYFDEAFHAYKEDVDLAWRLRLAGWRAWYVPAAVAYHFRRAAGHKRTALAEIAANRSKKSSLINYLSYRNHLLTLLKNEHGRNFLRHALWIGGYEGAKFFYLLLCEPKTLRAIIDWIQWFPRTLQQRKMIMARTKVSAADMRRWFE